MKRANFYILWNLKVRTTCIQKVIENFKYRRIDSQDLLRLVQFDPIYIVGFQLDLVRLDKVLNIETNFVKILFEGVSNIISK